MKGLFMTAASLLVVAALAPAQGADRQSQGQGYLFVGPILTSYPGQSGGLSTGFGGELFIPKWMGVGAELVYASSYGANMGMGSIDFSYHFLSKKSLVQPFVAAGPSLYFGQRSTKTGFNPGGDINYWVAKHFALRFEVRDNFGIGNEEFLGITHFIAFRFGPTFK